MKVTPDNLRFHLAGTPHPAVPLGHLAGQVGHLCWGRVWTIRSLRGILLLAGALLSRAGGGLTQAGS